MPEINVSVFGSSQSQPGDAEYEAAIRLGGLLVQQGWAVVNGGYGGLMEAVSVGAARSGGMVIGVTAPAVFPGREGANPYLSEERPAPDLVTRIGTMLDISQAAIALPGSIGTLTELLMAWNVSYVAPFSGRQPIPLITVGRQWSDLVPIITEGVSTKGALVTCVDSVEAAVTSLISKINGRNPQTN